MGPNKPGPREAAVRAVKCASPSAEVGTGPLLTVILAESLSALANPYVRWQIGAEGRAVQTANPRPFGVFAGNVLGIC